jgi:hypothetical protein
MVELAGLYGVAQLLALEARAGAPSVSSSD